MPRGCAPGRRRGRRAGRSCRRPASAAARRPRPGRRRVVLGVRGCRRAARAARPGRPRGRACFGRPRRRRGRRRARCAGRRPGRAVRLVVQRPVEDDGHPRLARARPVRRRAASALSQNAWIRPVTSAADDDDRVHDVPQLDALPHDLGGDRVDEEGHVVGDDADDGAAVGQPLDVDRGRALRADLRQPQVAEREPGELGRVVAEHLGGGLAPVVALQQRGQVGGGAARGQLGVRPEPGGGGLGRPLEQATASRPGRPPGRRARSGTTGCRRPAGVPGSPGPCRRRAGGARHVRPRYCVLQDRRHGGAAGPSRDQRSRSGRRPSRRPPGRARRAPR